MCRKSLFLPARLLHPRLGGGVDGSAGQCSRTKRELLKILLDVRVGLLRCLEIPRLQRLPQLAERLLNRITLARRFCVVVVMVMVGRL